MRHSVKANIGVSAITFEDGQKVYDAIYPELHAQHEVELDFANVKIIAAPFLNAAVGQLLREFTPDELNKNLKITNLPALAWPVVQRVIENAEVFYRSAEMRAALDKALEREAYDSF